MILQLEVFCESMKKELEFKAKKNMYPQKMRLKVWQTSLTNTTNNEQFF